MTKVIKTSEAGNSGDVKEEGDDSGGDGISDGDNGSGGDVNGASS